MMDSRRTPEQVREAIAARVMATQRVLEAEVARLVSGEDWVRFLAFQARLYRYSILGEVLYLSSTNGWLVRDLGMTGRRGV
jgi:hypothetical protein